MPILRDVPRLRWGILATGGIAHAFAADLRTAGRDVHAVGSRSAAAAERFAAQFEVARAHGSYRDLLADDEVDIVYIATPHDSHAEHALAAIAQGKHVLVEKAFTLTGAQAAAVQQAAEQRGVLAMEAMWTRYLPHMTRIRELARSGALGEVRAVFADHTQRLPVEAGHRLNALSLGGGALLDLGIYPVSFAVDMLGLPDAVTARGRLGETGADTEAATILTHASGAISTSLSSSRGAGPNVAHVVGDAARIDIDRVWYTPTSFRLITADGETAETFSCDVAGRGMQYQALAAEHTIAEGRRDSEVLPIAETVAIMRVLDEVRSQLGVRYPQEE